MVAIKTREEMSGAYSWSGDTTSREVEVGEGSGFVFHTDDKFSFILTNSHVVLRMSFKCLASHKSTGLSHSDDFKALAG